MEALASFLSNVGAWAWGLPLLSSLLVAHVYLTIRLRVVQRFLPRAIRLSFRRERKDARGISLFGSLTTALAATSGTGNIFGVAAAVATGGPGAVLWIWLTGVFGIATRYSEALLSVKYRTTDQRGEPIGGPMYVLERALGWRWLALLFALFTAIAAFGSGNMSQANSMATLLDETLGLPPWMTGMVISSLTGAILLGGVRRIARVCEVLVPFMVIFYCFSCALLLCLGWRTLPHTCAVIWSSAFCSQALAGAIVGATVREAIRYGLTRGLVSNAAGLGSAPIVAAAADTPNPVQQALVSSTGTFWDTMVICLMTGLVVVNGGEWEQGLSGSLLIRATFGQIPVIGPWLLSIALLTFVYSAILGWSYCGEKATQYLLGSNWILPYRVVWVVAIFVGAVVKIEVVWDLADIANALMAFPNLIALIVLIPVIVAETRHYLWEDRLEERAEA